MAFPNPIKKLLTGGDLVAPLVEQARWLDTLSRALRPLLEPPTGEHFSVTGLRNGLLSLQADAPAWAARLRYQVPQLLGRLQETLPDLGVASIRVTVAPVEAPPTAPSRRPAALSEANRLALQQTAAAVTEPKLRAALERLARRR